MGVKHNYKFPIIVGDPTTNTSEQAKRMFGTSFLPETAAMWWLTLVQNNKAPSTRQEFKQALSNEFQPEDHIHRARDRLRWTMKKGTVAKYISYYQNVIPAAPDISEGEKFDRFVDGLNPEDRLHFMKSSATTFEEEGKL